MEHDLEKAQRRHWERLASPFLLGELLSNPQQAERYLEDPDPNVRFAVFTIISDYWRPTKRFLQACEQGFNDPDENVRGAALAAAGKCYAKTGGRRLGRIMAEIVQDGERTINIRTIAYLVLCQIAGNDRAELHVMALAEGREKFPDDIDWVLVDSYR